VRQDLSTVEGCRSRTMPALMVFVLGILMCAPLPSGATGPWPKAVLEVACLFLLFLTLRTKQNEFVRPPGWLPLLILLGFCLLQLLPLPPALLAGLSPASWERYRETIWLVDPGAWLPLSLHPQKTLESFFRLASYGAFYFAVVQLFTDLRQIRRFVLVLVGGCGLYAALGLVQFLLPSERVFWLFIEWPERTAHHFASYVNGNHYAGLMAMLLPLALALAVSSLPRRIYSSWRVGIVEFFSNPDTLAFCWLTLVSVVIGTSIFFSLSRGGILATLGALLAFFLLYVAMGPQRKSFILPVFVFVLVLSVVGWIGWNPVFARFAEVRSDAGELNTQRLEFWTDSVELLKDHPVFGTGFGTFADVYPRVQSVKTGKLVDHAHNDYVETAVEAGMVGMSLLGWFFIAVIGSSYRAVRRRRNPLSFHLWLAAFSGLVAILLHSLTDFNLQIPANGLVCFFLLALLTVAAHTRSRKGSARTDLPVNSLVCIGIYPLVALLIMVCCAGYGFASAITQDRVVEFEQTEREQLAKPSVRAKHEKRLQLSVLLDPLSGRQRFSLGQIAWMDGDLGQARDFFTRALKRCPVSSLYASGVAQAIAADGEHPDATELYRAAARNDRAEPRWWNDLGLWLISTNRLDDGLMAFQKVIALRPRQTRSILTTLILLGVSDLDLERAIPDEPEAHMQIAGYYADRGTTARAEFHMQQAIAFAALPQWRRPRIFSRVADYYAKAERTSQAFLVLKQGFFLFPDDIPLLTRLASLSERENLTQQALDYYRQLVLLDPHNNQARQKIATLSQ